jgi:ABC-type amino acid transport substrate-binding protein
LIFDSHAHYDDEAFNKDRDEVLDKIQKSGVKRILNCGSSIEACYSTVELAEKYDFIYGAVGVHPEYPKDAVQNINKIGDMALKNKKIAVQLGSVADIYVSSDIEGATVIQQKKFLSAAQDVISKKADCLIMDALPAIELVKNNKELTILDIELFTDKYAAAVAKGNTKLLNEINSVLKELMENGKIEEYTINHTNK